MIKLSQSLLRLVWLALAVVFLPCGESPAQAQLPAGVTNTPLPSALIREIVSLLPESKPLPTTRPDFIAPSVSPTLKLSQGGQVSLVFVDEGAGYKNSIGYFTYSDAGKVLDAKVIFANCSEYGGGGSLLPGDTVDMGRFPAGTNLGFYVVANGYSRGQTLPSQSSPSTVFYSLDALNPQKDRHFAIVSTNATLNDGSKPLLLGLEDLPLNSGDKDYNDAVFIIRVSPDALPGVIESGKIPTSTLVTDRDHDGVDDAKDAFPDDALRAFKTSTPGPTDFYFMAVEDLFPFVGDSDYNDLVTAFRITSVLNAQGKLVDLRFVHHAVARGAAYDHELHHRIRWTGGSAASSVVRRFEANGNPIEETRTVHTGGGADLVVFASTHEVLFDARSTKGFANTEKGLSQVRGGYSQTVLTFDQPVDLAALEAAPFDPYLLVLDTGFDVHLVGKTPRYASPNPKTDAGSTFIDANGYPFCMLVPSAWSYPEERVSIDSVYPDFALFRQSKGTSNLDWFRHPASTGVRTYTFAE